ncbi:hypothetical protein [Acinetobacter sp. CFCC 11171]|uniref:hypothetical protein n=1 Tax=Acinetobacter sp. CFCC 11171 TaxID=1775558 RepID=UPI001D1732A0|nr:hypothetical protein [Acinetobacter sp. CFCC 11171]
MIGITSKGELISVNASHRPKGVLTGILITDPEQITVENLTKIKLRFYGSDGQLNQHHCLSVLNISQDQIDPKGDESSLQLQKFDLLGLTIRRSGAGIQIHVSTKPLGRLLQYLSKKLQS